ncbi:hypothetical protein CSKR_112587 [Clonorchis sinensis]|uniref:Uncharacterized protein n=1 Tax=Clonorchis sinensis TaxID=79923 RepID=A0A419PZG3_CLOSI|nr:hypothetical protein CSKR_112587 [Clonorchis sinensis]
MKTNPNREACAKFLILSIIRELKSETGNWSQFLQDKENLYGSRAAFKSERSFKIQGSRQSCRKMQNSLYSGHYAQKNFTSGLLGEVSFALMNRYLGNRKEESWYCVVRCGFNVRRRACSNGQHKKVAFKVKQPFVFYASGMPGKGDQKPTRNRTFMLAFYTQLNVGSPLDTGKHVDDGNGLAKGANKRCFSSIQGGGHESVQSAQVSSISREFGSELLQLSYVLTAPVLTAKRFLLKVYLALLESSRYHHVPPEKATCPNVHEDFDVLSAKAFCPLFFAACLQFRQLFRLPELLGDI